MRTSMKFAPRCHPRDELSISLTDSTYDITKCRMSNKDQKRFNGGCYIVVLYNIPTKWCTFLIQCICNSQILIFLLSFFRADVFSHTLVPALVGKRVRVFLRQIALRCFQGGPCIPG